MIDVWEGNRVPENVTALTKETFRTYTGSQSCLVILFRQHCPHCQVLMAVIDKCRSLCTDLAVAGVDVDAYPEILQALGVSRVPTVLVYRNGEVSARRSGVMSPSELLTLLASPNARTV